MKDYAYGVETVRAVKYALEKESGFAQMSTRYQNLEVYTNEEDGYYNLIKDLYLDKYEHSEQYYEMIRGSSRKSSRQLLKYIKSDIERCGKSVLQPQEQEIIEEARKRRNAGDTTCMYKPYEEILYQIDRDENIESLGMYEVTSEGYRITISGNFGIFADEMYHDEYVIDLERGISFSEGKRTYIREEIVCEEMLGYAKHRIENKWMTEEHLEERREKVDEYLKEIAEENNIDLKKLDYAEYRQLQENALILSEYYSVMNEMYEKDRERRVEVFHEEFWDPMIKYAMLASMAALIACPPAEISLVGLVTNAPTVFSAGLVYADAGMKAYEGDYEEAIMQAGVETTTIALSLGSAKLSQYITEQRALREAEMTVVDDVWHVPEGKTSYGMSIENTEFFKENGGLDASDYISIHSRKHMYNPETVSTPKKTQYGKDVNVGKLCEDTIMNPDEVVYNIEQNVMIYKKEYPFNISTSDTPTGIHRVFIPLNTQGRKTIRMSQFPLVGGN